MAETQPSQSIANVEAVSAASDIETYRQQRKRQLLAQANDIKDLRADVDRRRLSLIINHAVATAFV